MQGLLRKMSVRVPEGGCTPENPVQYSLRLDDKAAPLNGHVGSPVTLHHTGRVRCRHCGNATGKSYGQGYCYPCFKKLAQCDLCIVSPVRCHFDAGTCRDESFAEHFCMQPHIVYIANSSGIKVGITREENLPDRWIDQGAIQALPVMRVMTRQQSGFVEAAFGRYVADKTQWRRMLSADNRHLDLHEHRDRLFQKAKTELDALVRRFGLQAIRPVTGAAAQTFTYPMRQYPARVVSLSFDKSPKISGRLLGIKGQYLVLDAGVVNLRRFAGYEVTFSAGGSPGQQGRQGLP